MNRVGKVMTEFVWIPCSCKTGNVWLTKKEKYGIIKNGKK